MFPIIPDTKHPIANDDMGLKTHEKGGHHLATLDEATVREWWAKWPDFNIGIWPTEKYVIVDLDMKHGQNGLESICDALDVDPFMLITGTFVVQTTTGGYHIYYEVENVWGRTYNVLPGVDICGVTGYILGPGSTIGDASYDIYCDDEIVPVREDIIPYLKKPTDLERQDQVPVAGKTDTEGQIRKAKELLRVQITASKISTLRAGNYVSLSGEGGDNRLYLTCVQLKDTGISQETAYELIMEPGGWNDHCKPIWDKDTVTTKLVRAFKYGKNRPGDKGGGTMELYMEHMSSNGHVGIPMQDIKEMVLVSTTDPFARLRSMTFTSAEFEKREIRREMIIPEWLPADGFSAILSTRGAGKSVLMLDIALRVTCGMDWHGYPTSRKGWKVVYFCGEDDVGFGEQQKSWIKHYGVEPESGLFHIIAGMVDLLSQMDVDLWAEYLTELTGGEKTILMIDTWQRATMGASQSDDDAMQIAVHNLEHLSRAAGGPSLVAFHPPKNNDDTIIGSSIISNATVAIWNLKQSATSRKLEVERMKGKGEGNYQNFKFVSVDLEDIDEFGSAYTGVFPERIGGVEMGETNSIVKRALALTVKELDLDRKNNFPNSKPFSIRAAVDAITELETHKDTEWASKLQKTLRDAGITHLTRTKLATLIQDVFVEDSTPYRFGDGNLLELITKGTYKYFNFRADAMTETPTESEEEDEDSS